MYKLPIGVSNFQKLASGDYLFCDKTAMIAEFLSKGDEVTLITRPRRWGKTLNMSMLQHFFSAEVNGVSTTGLFDDLKIGKLDNGHYIRTYQGKSPVIMISFKDVNASSFESAYHIIYGIISSLYGDFEYLLSSNKLNTIQVKEFKAILNQIAHQHQLEASLELLSQCLYQHHGQKAYILIDEYDTPLNKEYGNQHYLDAIVQFMHNLFSASLKGNYALERGVLTGILRISKDSMLSGLNNLVTYTLLDNEYSNHFGFSDQESKDLFIRQGLSIYFDQARDWYNGYKSGDLVVYNPWSIISCLSEEGRFDVYWVNTGNNDLIKNSLLYAKPGIKSMLEQLMSGTSVLVTIDKHLSFDQLGKDETALWSLLLFGGYLQAEKVTFNQNNGLYDCDVVIPNKEVHTLYNRFFSEWFIGKFYSKTCYSSFLTHLVSGNVPLFIRYLRHFLLESSSCFDTKGPKSENFYHGFVLGIIASLGSSHYVRSNRESGLGRYDVLLIPKQGTVSLLLEFKQVYKEEELESSANLALQQIKQQAYRSELLQYPTIKEVVEVSIAFSGKSVVAAYSIYDLVHKQTTPVALTDRYNDDDNL